MALSGFDDKRYLINNIESVPLGHYQIKYAQASLTDGTDGTDRTETSVQMDK